MENRNETLKKLVLSAMMIAIGTVLSLDMFKFGGIWAFGGGVTFCSMLPLVIVSYAYGCKWGVFTAFVYSVLQALLGVDNIQYATSFGMAGAFKKVVKNQNLALVLGIFTTFFARFACHFITGWAIWDALWPNEFGFVSPLYSLFYNGSYMLPEAVITSVVAVLLYKMAPRLFKKI